MTVDELRGAYFSASWWSLSGCETKLIKRISIIHLYFYKMLAPDFIGPASAAAK